MLVWTDHRNLQYISSARHLNARQEHQSLFFSRFNFILSYRPTKPNALSCQFDDKVDCDPREETILPPVVLGVMRWDLEKRVRDFKHVNPVPGGCPPGCFFVPLSFCQHVLWWGHDSQLSPRDHPNNGPYHATVMVAGYKSGCTSLYDCLSYLCKEQGSSARTGRLPTSSPGSCPSMVSHLDILYYRAAFI